MTVNPVNVKLSFTDKNGRSATREFLIEEGIIINFSGNGKSSEYKVTKKGVIDLRTNKPVKGSIMTTKEQVAALQGISQVNADSNIARTRTQSVLTAKDIAESKYGKKNNFLQMRINDLEDKIGSTQKLHLDTYDVPGARFDYNDGELNINLVDPSNRNNSSVCVSSEQSRKEAKAVKAANNKNWSLFNPFSWPIFKRK